MNDWKRDTSEDVENSLFGGLWTNVCTTAYYHPFRFILIVGGAVWFIRESWF